MRSCSVFALAVVLAACSGPSELPDAGTDAWADADAGADAGAAPDAWRDTTTALCRTDSRVGLPADDGVHPRVPVEWWYWTGHVHDAAGRWFGYQATFFAFGFGGMLMNVALTDLDGAAFHRDGQFAFATPTVLPSAFSFSLGSASATGGGGSDHLVASFDGVAFDLRPSSTATPLLQHGDGYEDYPFGGSTYYYSRPRMDTTGTVTVGGTTFDVTGATWFDHQWGDLSSITGLGWDWFAIQLDDGRDLMLLTVHGGAGYASGTITDGTCAGTRELTAAQISITPRGSWTSPTTGCVYPMGWDVIADGIHLGVAQVIDPQEHPDPMNVARSYWEGASTVTGDATGRAYVELTGYCGP